jgi:hypothetical protein
MVSGPDAAVGAWIIQSSTGMSERLPLPKKRPPSTLISSIRGEGFRAIPHNPPNGWQPKFARQVYQSAGVQHPRQLPLSLHSAMRMSPIDKINAD